MSEMIKEIDRRSRERYRRDARFHALATSIVARVMNDHGRVDPERADQEAADIATRVAALVLETVFTEDAELNVQREIAERYCKLAEDALACSPILPPIFIGSKA